MTNANVDWHGAISVRSKIEAGRVADILASQNILPSPVLAAPRRLRLQQLVFSGEKVAPEVSGPFSFSWEDLDVGLWALMTEHNLVGKSSVFEIIKWLIRGRAPSNLQDDVRSWIHHASLTFQIDDARYTVDADTRNATVRGQLMRHDLHKEPVIIAEFHSDAEFESAMSYFFLHELSMDHLTAWREDGNKEDPGGTTVTHGWVAFAGAMFIGTDYSVLLGDLPVTSGISARLMQMFLGIPWVSTLAAIKSALKAAQNEKEARGRRRRIHDQDKDQRKHTLQEQLNGKQAALQALSSDDEARKNLSTLEIKYAAAKRREYALTERLEREEAAVRLAAAALLDDQRDLQSHLDTTAAGTIFRMLDPSCCPRCDHAIDAQRKKQEQTTHACAVCGESIADDENAEAIKKALMDRVQASKNANAVSVANQLQVTQELKAIRRELEALQAQIQAQLALLGSFSKRNDLAMEIAVLRGRLEEAAMDTSPKEVDGIDDVIAVLHAAEKETEERVKAVQTGILADVSERIVHFAQHFGMHNLTNATLRGNANLLLTKGGADTSYSKVTQGEQLRLKVATVLAMMEVAERRGVGRHPGLLLIDSPGAQEVAPEDLDHLVGGLANAAKTLPYFQVFVAAAGVSSHAIAKHVSANRRREPLMPPYLW